jgi:3-isopropylmalate dehydrogenase
MTRVFREVAKDFPNIPAWEANIDAICMWLLKKPQEYDVLVAENMFGDIISDLAAGLVGGLGYAASANVGDNYAVFEPTHGSAPKYAGQYKVNPMAMLLTCVLMFEWLGEKELAKKLEAAVARVTAERSVGTYDVGLSNSTMEVGEEVARYATGRGSSKPSKPAPVTKKRTANMTTKKSASGKKTKTSSSRKRALAGR